MVKLLIHCAKINTNFLESSGLGQSRLSYKLIKLLVSI